MTHNERQYRFLTAWLVGLLLVPAVMLLVSGGWFARLGNQASAWDCACGVMSVFNHPKAIFLGQVSGYAGLGWMVLVLTTAVVVWLRQQRTLRPYLTHATPAPHLSEDIPVLVSANVQPLAMTIGLFQPRILLTTGVQHELGQDEVTAVIAHESHHARRFDPLWSIIVAVAERLLGWVPVVRRSIEQWTMLREVTADEAATNFYSDRSGLAGALVKMSTPLVVSTPLFSPNIARVEQLLHPERALIGRIWSFNHILVVMMVVITAGLFVRVGTAWATAPSATTVQQCQEIHRICRRATTTGRPFSLPPRPISSHVFQVLP